MLSSLNKNEMKKFLRDEIQSELIKSCGKVDDPIRSNLFVQ